MNFTQVQIPYLPVGWTLRRTAGQLSKLGLFVLIPGFHQIASKRVLFGSLLLALYIVSEFGSLDPTNSYSTGRFVPYELYARISYLVKLISWLLLAHDFRTFGTHQLRFGHLLPISCITALLFLSTWERQTSPFLIVDRNDFCPTFCRGDIVEWTTYESREAQLFEEHRSKIPVGEYLVIQHPLFNLFVSRLVAAQSDIACADDGGASLNLPRNNVYCDEALSPNYFEFLVIGGPRPHFKGTDDRTYTMVSENRVEGIQLSKLGNLRQVELLGDGLSKFVGYGMLSIYQWTGVNFFTSSN